MFPYPETKPTGSVIAQIPDANPSRQGLGADNRQRHYAVIEADDLAAAFDHVREIDYNDRLPSQFRRRESNT